MRFLFYLSWILLATAFILTAADPFLATLGKSSIWTSTYDVWYAYSPGSLIISQINVEKLSPVLWNTIIVAILQMPGWLLLGVPGAILAWTCRPNKVMPPEVREEYERRKESLFVFDELSEQALNSSNYNPDEDDQKPVHLLFGLSHDEEETMSRSRADNNVPANYPAAEYLENWNPDLTAEDADGMGGVNTDMVKAIDADSLPYDTISTELDVNSLPPPGSIVTKYDKEDESENNS